MLFTRRRYLQQRQALLNKLDGLTRVADFMDLVVPTLPDGVRAQREALTLAMRNDRKRERARCAYHKLPLPYSNRLPCAFVKKTSLLGHDRVKRRAALETAMRENGKKSQSRLAYALTGIVQCTLLDVGEVEVGVDGKVRVLIKAKVAEDLASLCDWQR